MPADDTTIKKKKSAILIFTKLPKSGYVKTRLQSSILSMDDTMNLHQSFLLDTIKSSILSDANYLIFSVAGIASKKKYIHKNKIEFINENNNSKIYDFVHIQSEGTFGERMKDAIIWCFEQNISKLVILGADSPHIQPTMINHSFDKLDTYDLVIGPSPAGGIYLIGINNRFKLDNFEYVFDNVELTSLARLANSNGLTGYILPELIDIDVEEDLIGLIAWIDSLKYLQYNNSKSELIIPMNSHDTIKKLGLRIQVDNKNNRTKRLYRLNIGE